MKYYLVTKQYTREYDVEKPEDIEITEEIKDEGIEGIYSSQDCHVCKYCHGIAPGNYEDLLCDECREIFGHALYSEL